jgi:uncharacterized coiled-coil protein SlyX
MDTVLELQASLNSKGKTHAAALIKRGAVSESRSWDGPSASAENNYLEEHSWAEFGAWFLGVDNEAEPETKGHYKYPFSDDFKTVSVNGLRAIRSRAGQTDEQEIFDAAGPLLDAAKEKLDLRTGKKFLMPCADGKFKLEARFNGAQEFEAVDRERGTLSDVSILEVGEARGHGVLITPKTVQSAAKLLIGQTVPAYLSHDGAFNDRLTEEIGIFKGFYMDGERLRARTFNALESFKKFHPEEFETLFELAEKMPDNFGVSIVFNARLYWQLEDDAEQDFEGEDEPPEGAAFNMPSVQVLEVLSADFVDTPAANSSLFSEPKPETNETMNIELTTAASDELEKRNAAEAEEKKPAPKKKVAKGKKKLEDDEGAEMLLNELELDLAGEQDVIDDLETRLIERDGLIKGMQEQLATLTDEIKRLRDLMDGADALPEDAAPEVVELDAKALKANALAEVLADNPNLSRSSALLEVGKKNPEYFLN